MTTRMLQRRGTAAEWASANPVLGPGEFGFESDTGLVKVGNDVDNWNDLDYIAPGAGTRLNYVEITEQSDPITTLADVDGLAFTITGLNRPVKLKTYLDTITPSAADQLTAIYISNDDNDYLSQMTVNHNVDGVFGRTGATCECWVGPAESGNRALAEGVEEVYKVRMTGVNGSATIEASPTYPSYFEAVVG